MAGLVQKIKEMWNPSDEYFEEETQESNSDNNSYFEPFQSKNKSTGSPKGTVLNMHRNSDLKSKIVLCRPEHFGEEIKNIADELLKMHAVVLNLELAPKSESRRLIDFLSGIAYAIEGKIKKVSADIFVITPRNMEIEGEDILSELETGNIYF